MDYMEPLYGSTKASPYHKNGYSSLLPLAQV